MRGKIGMVGVLNVGGSAALAANGEKPEQPEQAEAEADRLREQARIKEQEEKARELEKQAGQIRENRESLMAAIEAMPADVKAAYEQEFIETGMMNPFTQKQYQKRGMEGVKTAFIFFIEEKLNTGEVIT